MLTAPNTYINQAATSKPEALGYMEQAFNELENQTRCLDNAIGVLEGKLRPVLQPSPPQPAGAQGGTDKCGDGPHSDYVNSLRGYASMLQSFCARINDLRERAEC